MTATDSIIAIAGFLLLAGAFSNKVSSRFNLPTLLLFLAAGVCAETILPFNGANYAGQINFFGIAAMCFILFSGGSDTPLSSIRKVALRGILLARPGVIITALITTPKSTPMEVALRMGCSSFFPQYWAPKTPIADPVPSISICSKN